MTVQEFIEQNEKKYAIIDIDCGEEHWDNVGHTFEKGLQFCTELQVIMNLDISEVAYTIRDGEKYIKEYMNNIGSVEDWVDYRKEDEFCSFTVKEQRVNEYIRELKEKLYDYLEYDVDSIDEDEKNDLLTENADNDGNVIYWYADNSKNASITIDGKILDKEETEALLL
jgi:hypothetical protein